MTDKAKLPPEGNGNPPASTDPASGGKGEGAAKTGEAALEESLAEVNFFVQQGLLVESIHMLRELKKIHGDHPRIIGRENAVRVLLRQNLSASDSGMKASQVPDRKPAGPQAVPAQPTASAPQKAATAPTPQQPAVDDGATVVTKPPAATLDRLRKLKDRARAGTGQPATEQKPAVPGPASKPESDLPPPLPPVPEVQDTKASPKPLYPARSMTLPMGSAPAAVPTDKTS